MNLYLPNIIENVLYEENTLTPAANPSRLIGIEKDPVNNATRKLSKIKFDGAVRRIISIGVPSPMN